MNVSNNITDVATESIFKISLNNKEIVKVHYKPYNGLLVHFSFYGCVSETGYRSHFMYRADKVWNKFNSIKDIAKAIAEELYKESGYKYFAQLQQKQQLALF